MLHLHFSCFVHISSQAKLSTIINDIYALIIMTDCSSFNSILQPNININLILCAFDPLEKKWQLSDSMQLVWDILVKCICIYENIAEHVLCEYWFGSCRWFMLSVPVAHYQHQWSAFKVQWHLRHFQNTVHLSFQEGPFDLRHVICGCRAVIYCCLFMRAFIGAVEQPTAS